MADTSKLHISRLTLLLAFSWSLRVILILYGALHDQLMTLKYTDIDYTVFSNASKFLLQGQSPYLCPTYRYTPLIALLLVPNHLISHLFGKFIFITLDIYVAQLIYKILSLRDNVISENSKLFSCAIWLFNPVTAIVSSRGNSESLMATIMLLCLYCVMTGRQHIGALLYGMAIHVKVYPVIHCVALLLSIDETPWDRVRKRDEYYRNPALKGDRAITNNQMSKLRIKWSLFFTAKRIQFVTLSISSFTILTALFYLLYGWEFLFQTYLYHITRTDINHNFSIYFYILHITKGTWIGPLISKMAFIPQGLLILLSTVWFYNDLPMCAFVQTFLFVTFNKVVTSQYFLWYLCYLPLIIPFSSLTVKQAMVMSSLWLTAQGLWLLPAYLLEYQGMDTYIFIGLASCAFFITNVWIIVIIIRSHHALLPLSQIKRLKTN